MNAGFSSSIVTDIFGKHLSLLVTFFFSFHGFYSLKARPPHPPLGPFFLFLCFEKGCFSDPKPFLLEVCSLPSLFVRAQALFFSKCLSDSLIRADLLRFHTHVSRRSGILPGVFHRLMLSRPFLSFLMKGTSLSPLPLPRLANVLSPLPSQALRQYLPPFSPFTPYVCSSGRRPPDSLKLRSHRRPAVLRLENEANPVI